MITVGFSTQRGAVSWLIRKVTRSTVSHTWICFYDPLFDADMVLEAGSLGFHLSPFEQWKSTNTIVRMFKVGYPLEPGLHAVRDFLGTQYDIGGLFGMAVVLAGRWFKRRWKNPLRSSKQVFCSEAVIRALQGAGVPGSDMFDPDATSPEDLMEWLASRRF